MSQDSLASEFPRFPVALTSDKSGHLWGDLHSYMGRCMRCYERPWSTEGNAPCLGRPAPIVIDCPQISTAQGV
jgi:hypothetical protein